MGHRLDLAALLLFLICVSWTTTGQPRNSVSSAECSRDKPPFSFVRGQDSTMWDIVLVSPQKHRSVSVCRHFLLQAPQCPCSMRKRFSRVHYAYENKKKQRPLLLREVEAQLPDCGVAHYVRIDHLSRLPVMPPSTFDVNWLQVQPQQLPGWMSVVAMVGWGYQAGLANCHVWQFAPPACQWQPSFIGLAVQCWRALEATGEV